MKESRKRPLVFELVSVLKFGEPAEVGDQERLAFKDSSSNGDKEAAEVYIEFFPKAAHAEVEVKRLKSKASKVVEAAKLKQAKAESK
ncbi:Hypothetical predicted protein [Olea europaea subsp. europaea]|uniref:Uncharacterized protein n=1 Tax=Olea europaea subsp. europaea TaxID=158383 RepID=A0A8S0PQP3_OLEEU|nr:Hypothetical predicted protein [Olea europaea subsp. europaea]